jgi:hypothetical protein
MATAIQTGDVLSLLTTWTVVYSDDNSVIFVRSGASSDPIANGTISALRVPLN